VAEVVTVEDPAGQRPRGRISSDVVHTQAAVHARFGGVVPELASRDHLQRGLPVLDATCPLVSKVHSQSRRYVAQGRTLILIGHAGHVAAGPVLPHGEAKPRQIETGYGDDRNGRGSGPRGARRGCAAGNDERDRTADEIARKHCQSIALAVGKAVIDRQVLRFHQALLLQALSEPGRIGCVALGRDGVQESNQRQLPRLTDGARRREDGAAEKAGELSSPDGHASHTACYIGAQNKCSTWRPRRA